MGKAKKKVRDEAAGPAQQETVPEVSPPPKEAGAWMEPPKTPDALHAWIASVLKVRIARRAVVPGHAAPFDYVCHSYFEGTFPRKGAAGWNPSNPDCVVWANRGGGKTYLGALATLLDLVFKPTIQVRILGGSLEQSQRMFAYLKMFIHAEGLKDFKPTVRARRITLHNGSAAEVLAASETSVRGTRVQKIRCDEVDLFDRDVWEAAQLVTRSLPNCKGPWGDGVRAGVEALSTMHRPYGLMWELAGDPTALARADARPGNYEKPTVARPLFRWGVLDALEHCTDEHTCETCVLHPECQGRAKTIVVPGQDGHFSVADAVAQKVRVGVQTWEAEMLCLRPSRGSAVYAEFDAATHVTDDDSLDAAPPRYTQFIGGMDFGFRSEGAVLLAGVERDGTVVVLREHVRSGQRVSQHVAAITRWLDKGLCRACADGEGPGIAWIGIDPAGNAVNPQTGEKDAEIVRDADLKVRFRSSEIAEGVRLVRDRFAPAVASPSGRPRLLVHRSCRRLIECLTRYRYDPGNPTNLNPLKEGFDHACDALRYMILNLDVGHRVDVRNYLP